MHGGGAPQVKRTARERLAALAEPAVGVMATLLKRSKAAAVQLGAARDVLDRTLGRAPLEISVGETRTSYLRFVSSERLGLMRDWVAEAKAAEAAEQEP